MMLEEATQEEIECQKKRSRQKKETALGGHIGCQPEELYGEPL